MILGSKNSSEFDTDMKTATGGSGKVYYFKAGKKVALYITNKFTGVSVRKVWLDENGGIQTSGMPDRIQVQLYQQKTQLDAKTVTLNFVNGGNIYYTKSYSVKPGSEFEIILNDWHWTTTVNETSRLPNDGKLNCNLGSITDDCIVNLSVGWEVGGMTDDRLKDTVYVPATYTSGTDVKVKIGSPITLSGVNNWSYTWTKDNSELQATDGTGAPYYYSVEEVGVPTGYSVSYTNNNGIIVGGNEMVITNKADKKPIVLPETGGTGTYWYTMGGVLLTAGAAFLIYKKHMQKGASCIIQI